MVRVGVGRFINAVRRSMFTATGRYKPKSLASSDSRFFFGAHRIICLSSSPGEHARLKFV